MSAIGTGTRHINWWLRVVAVVVAVVVTVMIAVVITVMVTVVVEWVIEWVVEGRADKEDGEEIIRRRFEE